MLKKSLWMLIILLMISGCGRPDKGAPAPITVSAAISMKDALMEIVQNYKQKTPNVEINLNFGASGTLRQQIEQGAPVDLFISADQKNMDLLQRQKKISVASRRDILGNKLMLVTAKGISLSSLSELTSSKVNKVAIGSPDFVPAGKYAKDALTNLGLWSQVTSKMVMGKDVRQVLTYVSTGDADAGFVYLSDTKNVTGINIIPVPEDTYKPIVYPAALTIEGANKEAVKGFYSYLTSLEAKKVFQKYGFTPLAK